ncbi:zinc-dependent alcohol dehydrogenase [Chelativorans alearense]|uniref:zinc-dependent alcohol dehydrogenase n=1 Tax=Chelativorans alearense TaxID=2681495 RepID=UPI0013D6D937|nr:alcohol dehydrogenase catalytic domain-containing protein [Chelativorans alearense]
MKAALFDTVGRPLRIDGVDDPRPGADEVLLKIAACGICGSDLHMTEDPATFGIGQGAVLGHEFAGEIVELGADVTGLAKGDRVAVAPVWGCGHCARCRAGDPAWCAEMKLIGGGYAEFSAVAARQCRKLPEGVPLLEGALAEPTAIGLHSVMRSGLKPGDTVLILGAGPIGLLVAFWARRMGARHVVVADLNDYQKERAEALGATGFAISGPGLADAFQDMAGGPPDIVFECVGKKGLIDFSCRLARVHGTVVGVGLCVGGDEWDPFAVLSKELTIVMAAFFDMHEFALALDALASQGPFRPQNLITDRIGLSDVPEAFEALRRRTTQCKVLIEAAA